MRLGDARIGVLYPWPGLPGMDRGAARRVVPLLSVLAARVRSLEVLCPGAGEPLCAGNITYAFYRPNPAEKLFVDAAFQIFDGITHHAWGGRVPVDERRQWWHYLHPRLLPSLRREIGRLAARSDVLMAEYPFWVDLLPGRSGSKPLVLSLHDVLSDRVSQPWLRERVRREELSAIRRAQAVVCCSEADRNFYRARGVEAECVPHAIRLERLTSPAPPAPDGGGFRMLARRRGEGATVCFFVGSSHQPNREAVSEISGLACKLREDPRFCFVVAGSCSAPGRTAANEIHLGPISEGELDWLYSVTDIVLVPLRSGTGTSFKTLEALARKKVLLSTSVGARGFPLESGRDAIICDDSDQYPEILCRLADSPEAREKLAEGGWKFAQKYDAGRVYEPYVEVVNRLLANLM